MPDAQVEDHPPTAGGVSLQAIAPDSVSILHQIGAEEPSVDIEPDANVAHLGAGPLAGPLRLLRKVAGHLHLPVTGVVWALARALPLTR